LTFQCTLLNIRIFLVFRCLNGFDHGVTIAFEMNLPIHVLIHGRV
jgi:hypothetical protein